MLWLNIFKVLKIAVFRISTKILSNSLRNSTRGRIASSMPAVSMLMLGCLRYLTNTTPDIRNNSGMNKISSCQVLLGPDDAVLSDELNHASIIDGIRLCRAKRLRYKHMDLSDLESKLKESQVSADKYKRKCNAPIKPFSGSINW